MKLFKSSHKTHSKYQKLRRLRQLRTRKGSFLIEASVSLFLLVAIAMVLFDGTINILRPRNWTMRQNLVDAYLSREVAQASRVDFDSIAAGSSAWGAGADSTGPDDVRGPTTVTVGQLPSFVTGGTTRAYTAQVYRTRIPLAVSTAVPDFKPAAGASLSLDDMGIRAYKLQSHVVYTLSGKTYVKSRTVIRSE